MFNLFNLLVCARLVVPDGAVHEEDEEIDAVEKRDDVVEATQGAPRQTHDPVTGVIDFTGNAPPSRYHCWR